MGVYGEKMMLVNRHWNGTMYRICVIASSGY